MAENSGRRGCRNIKWLGVGAVTLALAVAAVAIVALRPTPVPTGSRAPVTTLAIARSHLDNKARPFTIGVIGDSTGNGPDEWVALMGKWLGEQSGRPVTWSLWDNAASVYPKADALARGAGKPVTIWNGSASGRTAQYSFEHFSQMLPGAAAGYDLIIINHGHNHSSTDIVTATSRLVDRATRAYPQAVVTVTAQNPGGGAHQAEQAATVAALKGWAAQQNVPLIDVYSAWSKPGSMLIDDRHPDQRGEALWAKTVEEFLSYLAVTDQPG